MDGVSVFAPLLSELVELDIELIWEYDIWLSVPGQSSLLLPYTNPSKLCKRCIHSIEVINWAFLIFQSRHESNLTLRFRIVGTSDSSDQDCHTCRPSE